MGATAVALVAENPTGNGLVQVEEKKDRFPVPHGGHPVRAPVAARGTRSVARWTARLGDRGLLRATPRCLDGKVKIISEPLDTAPSPTLGRGLETVGVATWCDEESLAYGRADGTGTAWGRTDGRPA